jgi:DNA-binding LacI/PurR family transcriptional regulator
MDVKPVATKAVPGTRNVPTRLTAVVPESGRPLYLCVRDSLRTAIDQGIFQPGEQMPSTKELSEQMAVSLVTAHRALQELVACGVLQRSQGKGTFIHDRYPHRKDQISQCRVGLVIHRSSSIADYYHGQIFEGVRRESDKQNVDLILLRFGEDVRNECNGFLYLNPFPEEMTELENTQRRQPTIVVGARGNTSRLSSVDVDNFDLARQAIEHLVALGHSRVMFVGGAEQLSNSRDRRAGFFAACSQLRVDPPTPELVFTAESWRLSPEERQVLVTALTAKNRPTAIFAAGYYMALDVYSAAQQAGLNVPEDLSVISVDDPPSAEHLSPPLTTLRQPLVQLGQAAVALLVDAFRRNDLQPAARTLSAELVVRGSTAAAKR